MASVIGIFCIWISSELNIHLNGHQNGHLVYSFSANCRCRFLNRRWGICSLLRTAQGTSLHFKRFFKAATGEEIFVLKKLQRWAVGSDLSLVKNNCPITQIRCHIQIVSGDNFCMMKGFQQRDQAAARLGIQAGSGSSFLSAFG